MNQYWYIITQPFFIQISVVLFFFFFFSLFCSKKGSRIPHYGWLSYLLRLFLSLIVSQTFLVFDNFNRFEECWSCICRISLIWEHEFFWKSDSATRHVIGKVAQKLHSRNYSFFLLLLLSFHLCTHSVWKMLSVPHWYPQLCHFSAHSLTPNWQHLGFFARGISLAPSLLCHPQNRWKVLES